MATTGDGTRGAHRRRAIVALAALAALAPGCKTWHDFKERATSVRATILDSSYEDPKAEQKLAEAQELYAAGQYDKARKIFSDLADNQSNPTDLAEHARFMQAECRYQRGQFPEAVDTYHKLLMDFPAGPHRRECCRRMYAVADYWLNDFRDELDRRADEKGVLRWRPSWPNPFDRTRPFLDQEGRTLEALNNIWVQDMMGPDADKAIFWCGYVNFVRGNFQEADHFFSQMVELHKDSPLRTQAIAYAIQAKNNATGGPDYDGRKCAEALQLVHMAEASVPELTQDPVMAAKLTRAKHAIRTQQAEKDFRTAEYYERTGHPGSAVFYYELVRRRYAGTKYSEIAGERKDHLMAAMKDGRPVPGNDPFAIIQAKWSEVFGQGRAEERNDAEPPAAKKRPKVEEPRPVSATPPGSGPFQQGPMLP
jgi:outer membrane protein assembly factor BamD (BamD/ComL family)